VAAAVVATLLAATAAAQQAAMALQLGFRLVALVVRVVLKRLAVQEALLVESSLQPVQPAPLLLEVRGVMVAVLTVEAVEAVEVVILVVAVVVAAAMVLPPPVWVVAVAAVHRSPQALPMRRASALAMGRLF
jgi:hypothetical protein